MKILIIKEIEAGTRRWLSNRHPLRRGLTMDVDPVTAASLIARGHAVIAEIKRERAIFEAPEIR